MDENKIINEIVEKCTDKETSDKVINALKKKWGTPKFETKNMNTLLKEKSDSYSYCPVRG